MRGKTGRAGAAIVTVLLLLAGALSGASFYWAATGPVTPRKLLSSQYTPAQRTIMERIATANATRIAALRYLHFKMERTEIRTDNFSGKTTILPPTKMEMWIDEWTGIQRTEYRPQVLTWEGSKEGYSSIETTEINDGTANYSFELGQGDAVTRRDEARAKNAKWRRTSMVDHLALDSTNYLVHILNMLTQANITDNGGMHCPLDEETRDGRTLLRFREQFLNKQGGMYQQKTWLLDPAQDYLPVYYELSYPLDQEPAWRWTLKKAVRAENGALYAADAEAYFKDMGGSVTVKEDKIIFLQTLDSFPAEVTGPDWTH